MTLNKLASLIAKAEGKKSQVKIGDVREILRILAELEAKAYNRKTAKWRESLSPAAAVFLAGNKKLPKEMQLVAITTSLLKV